MSGSGTWVGTGRPIKPVQLPSGEVVELACGRGLQDVFEACFRAALREVRRPTRPTWGIVADVVVRHVYFVAGQLAAQGSSLDVAFLLNELEVWWTWDAPAMQEQWCHHPRRKP